MTAYYVPTAMVGVGNTKRRQSLPQTQGHVKREYFYSYARAMNKVLVIGGWGVQSREGGRLHKRSYCVFKKRYLTGREKIYDHPVKQLHILLMTITHL